MKLNLNQLTLLLIDAEYELMSNNSDEEVIKKIKKELNCMNAILGTDKTINSLVDVIFVLL